MFIASGRARRALGTHPHAGAASPNLIAPAGRGRRLCCFSRQRRMVRFKVCPGAAGKTRYLPQSILRELPSELSSGVDTAVRPGTPEHLPQLPQYCSLTALPADRQTAYSRARHGIATKLPSRARQKL